MSSPIFTTLLTHAVIFCGASFTPLLAVGFDSASASALSATHKSALVAVHAVVSVSPELIEGPPAIAEIIAQQPAQDQNTDITGVVIHGNGTVAIPLVAIDPSAVMGGGVAMETPLGKIKIGIKAVVRTAKIVTADGSEYDADLIFKDNKSGLALLKIKDALETPLAAVSLSKEVPLPAPFTQVCALSPLKAEFGRETAVRIFRTGVVIPAPSPLIDLGDSASQPGSAVFDDEGRFLGMTVLPMRGNMGDTPKIRVCILPASEMLRLGAKALK